MKHPRMCEMAVSPHLFLSFSPTPFWTHAHVNHAALGRVHHRQSNEQHELYSIPNFRHIDGSCVVHAQSLLDLAGVGGGGGEKVFLRPSKPFNQGMRAWYHGTAKLGSIS